MIKLLIGGSPCTFWSIAQKNNRETTASGIGWELFKNYLVAKEKFKPDYFLYENNVSAAQEIKEQIKKELDVYDGTFLMTDSGNRYIEINSALVSAQTRQRFYVHNCGDVDLPADRGIMLADILESGAADKEKAYCLRSVAGNTRDYFKKHHTQLVFEPVILSNPHGFNKGGAKYGKAPTLTATGKYVYNNQVLEPVRVGELPAANGEPSQSQACRIYGVTGKSVTLSAGGGVAMVVRQVYMPSPAEHQKAERLGRLRQVIKPRRTATSFAI